MQADLQPSSSLTTVNFIFLQPIIFMPNLN